MTIDSALNLGLPAAPLIQDQAIAGELQIIYNALRILQQVLDDAGIYGGTTTTSTVLDVAHGGTGANTLTGIVKGAGTSPLTAGNVTASDAPDLVPYSGATTNVNLGTYDLLAAGATFTDDITVNLATVGHGAGNNSSNAAFGESALSSNTTGTGNTAIGTDTLKQNTTGYENTAVGNGALLSVTTGYVNTAVGVTALRNNTAGNGNTAFGWSALASKQTGDYNVSVGCTVLASALACEYNTIVGGLAGAALGGLVNASGVQSGESYTIITVGTTNWVAIGAASNTVGVSFTATGSGSGSGKARANSSSISNNTVVGSTSDYTTWTVGSGNTILGANIAIPAFLKNNIILALGTGAIKAQYDGTNWLFTADNIVLDKASGKGIKVDLISPSFGWRDILGAIETRPAAGGGATAIPDYVAYRGSIYAYRFGTAAPDNHLHECFLNFHVPHDYVPSSEIYIHVHWSQITVDTGGTAGVPGVAKWYFDVSYADGHGTPGGAADPFIAPFTVSVTQQGSTTQYGHMIAEVQLTGGTLAASTVQVDGIFQVRVYRDPTDAADTLNQNTFVHFVDLHYQSTGIGTKQKAPDFYT